MNYFRLLLVLWIPLSLTAFELGRTVDRTSVTLGDPITLKLTAIRAPEEKLIFPGPNTSFGDFELKDMRSEEVQKGTQIEESHYYRLLLFKLGSSKIPSLSVKSAKDSNLVKFSDSVEIIVKKVQVADTSDIVDIYGQAKIGYGKWFYLTILGIILFLLVAVYLFDRCIRKRKREVPEAPTIVIPPEEQFEKEIALLLALDLLNKGEVKEFHFRISEILRRYLGARLGFYALESTTSELFAMLKTKAIEPAVMRTIEQFCEISDPVKFAKWIPTTAISENLITLCRDIVQKTTPSALSPDGKTS